MADADAGERHLAFDLVGRDPDLEAGIGGGSRARLGTFGKRDRVFMSAV